MVTLKDKISSLTSDSITVDFFVSLSRSSSWHLYTSSKTTEWWGKACEQIIILTPLVIDVCTKSVIMQDWMREIT